MLRIAGCDDDLFILEELEAMIKSYGDANGQEISFVSYQTPIELLMEVERGERYDVLFLDIIMNGMNGMDTARELRQYDNNVRIIFLTSSPEFALKSYEVRAYDYQLKPIQKDTFIKLMNRLFAEQIREQDSSFLLKCKSGITRIQVAQLEYCEVINHRIYIHLLSGKELETRGRLEELYDKLCEKGNFLFPHRSYLVNMEYIQSITSRGIVMSCLAEIPIPHGKFTKMKDMYLEYLANEKMG
ncbi:MAG: LytTR family DNA-binding domain-containing protein [Lachnospiraceae bacterium]|nr:LytTR family DNA-binding domain-containing protein [Lachnospiraceae bacterium]